jgi:hypothetical protein
MSLLAAAVPLADTVLSLRLPEESIHHHVRQIHQDVLAHSRHIRVADFKAIHPRDLEFLFGAYDDRFLGGLCRRALNGRTVRFRLSRRMTRAGGMTTRFASQAGEVGYEIAVASTILFDSFGNESRRASACGVECASRLEALQRIFEHELVHVIEGLCWESSNCAAARFQDIAARLFLHRSHTHSLLTRRERAGALGIHPGSHVTFSYEGRQLTGRVNRITKRATILVEDTEGEEYSNGVRYTSYYVPIAHLKPLALRPTEA